jgi:hypothetical protein
MLPQTLPVARAFQEHSRGDGRAGTGQSTMTTESEPPYALGT